MTLKSEIFEQPRILAKLLESQWERVQEIAHELKKRDFNYIFLVARGTSDNAGRYAQYLLGAHNQIPMALAAPSIFTVYGNPPKLTGALALGISQSGRSPDIIQVIEEARRQGQPTLTITNNIDSPFAQAAEFTLDTCAGEEKAIAATKSYTTQLMMIAMLSAALEGNPERYKQLCKVPEYIEQVLAQDDAIRALSMQFADMDHCVVLGRGYNYATAYEWALKLKEITYVVAEPYSSADFVHGPIAMVDKGFPVLVIAPDGKVYPELFDLAHTLRQEKKAKTVVVSNRAEILAEGQYAIRLDERMPEWVSPIVVIVAGQLFFYHLGLAKGIDIENPRGLSKVTQTV